MPNRQKSSGKDIRSKIRHENVHLGGGTEMGGQPANQGLHSAAFAGHSEFRRPSQAATAQSSSSQFIQQQQLQQQQPFLPQATSGSSSNSRGGHHPSASVATTQSFTSAAVPPPSHQHPGMMARSGSGDGLYQPHPLGAGPSFTSLTPSDSASNFDGGRLGGGSGGGGAAMMGSMSMSNQTMMEPSAGSTASFAQGLGGDPGTPHRPARSGRRPQQQQQQQMQHSESAGGYDYNYDNQHSSSSGGQPPVAAGRNLLARKVGPSSAAMMNDGSNNGIAGGTSDRHARSARLMAQVMTQDDGRATPNSIRSEEDSAFGHPDGEGDDGRDMHAQYLTAPGGKSYDSQATISPPLGSLSRSEEPAALGSVLNALTQAGRKKGQARIMRGTTAEEESKRRKSERKVEMARAKNSRPLEYYVDRQDEKPFREICAVLRKIKEEWGFVVEDDFNSVSLALSLLDDSSLGASKREFTDTKVMIERALQGTVDDHYESFATAISLHNNVLSSLGSAQTGVSAARRRLRDAREALGAKRADLVQLWNRSQVVKESLRLLDTIETLKGVPDRLESLMSEKRFLEAVNLLMRSLKIIDKPDVAEVGASADLRGYLKGQEQAMFDILVEELHNHLYLKSFYCDSRWRPYVRGQSAIPNADFGKEYEEGKEESGREEGTTVVEPEAEKPRTGGQELKLFQYLKSLATRPNYDPDDMPDPFSKEAAAHSNGLGAGGLADSNGSIAGGAGGDATDQLLHGQNPEADSFLYIEMLLESLARLGKLKLTQEIIQQRLTIELHQLVDSTIDEVDARNEMLRRSSVMVMRPESLLLSNSSALARSFAENTRNSFRNSTFGRRRASFGSASGGTSLTRLSAQESSKVERDNETMRDLFWTLFSKLDAVLQGHRVVFEVVTKISSRGASSAYKAVKIGKAANLIEIWKPIQTEVRTLLYEYLMDDAETTSARRNILVSVNEVLRQGTFQRDRSKALFKLVADSAPKPGVNLSRKDFAPLRRHEEALTNALRASVPGLVGAADPSSGAAAGSASSVSIASFQQHSLASSAARGGSSFPGSGGHKLLVKPDAFNISVLFQPALAFIERVKMLLPADASGESDIEATGASGKGFSRFLDEFVKDVFLNQLEDKVQSLLTTAVGGPDAFQEDSSSRSWNSQRPVVRSATNMIVLIDSLYSMLRTTPFHRESYSHLIIQIIVQYYQACHDRFRDLITIESGASASAMAAMTTSPSQQRGGGGGESNVSASLPSYVISATWAQSPMVTTCLLEAVKPECEAERRKQLFAMENKLELGLAAKRTEQEQRSGRRAGTFALSDLTTSRKKLMALGHLQNSLLWVYEQIQKLKATDEDVTVTAAPAARLSLINKAALSVARDDAAGEEEVEDVLRLPMRHDMAVRFAALPRTFEHLSHIVLFTLRLEVRARTIRQLDLAINEGNYLLEDAVLEPDPQIVDLNAELASLDDALADTLLPQYHSFLFAGLASLMDLQMCQAIRKVRSINRHGLTKMIRNILALQQNLRNIVVIHETTSSSVSASTTAGNDDKNAKGQERSQGMWRQASVLSSEGFEKSTKLWELVGKEPEQILTWIRQQQEGGRPLMHSFDDYKCALNLVLGLENGPPMAVTSPVVTQGPFSSKTPTIAGGGGPQAPPGANLKPGTTSHIGGDFSRQKLNEYLIELHEVAGDAV